MNITFLFVLFVHLFILYLWIDIIIDIFKICMHIWSVKKITKWNTYASLNKKRRITKKKKYQSDSNFFMFFSSKMVQNLTSDWYADATRCKIDDSRTYNVSHYEPAFQILNDHGTSHISVLSADGSAVALTSTINYL